MAIIEHGMKIKFLTLLWLFSLFGVACGANKSGLVADGRPVVVATNSILGDLTHQIGGEQIQLVILVGANGDSHAFEPSPADSARLASATLIIENGLGLESWLDALYQSAGATGRRVVASEGIETIVVAEEADPHIWHDVTNAIQMTQNITAALITADPAHAATYQANSQHYIAQLEELDGWIVAQVALIPAGQRNFVTIHNTFAYFAARYQLKVIGTMLNASTTEVGDPSAGEMAALIEAIRAANAPAIFTENVANSELAQQIATEANVQLAPPLYSDALGEAGSPGATYLDMMRYNVSIIVQTLK